MKKTLILVIALLFVYLIVLGIPTKSALVTCSGTYQLNASLNKNITTDDQAFVELKNYWTVYNPNTCGGGKSVEDAIPSDMTAVQAKEQGILNSNLTITLDNGQNVASVWMIYQHRAIDSDGNVYFCKI